MEWDIREWYILIENIQEGPYSLSDLKKDLRLTPDTLVWKEKFPEWIKARFVPEMVELFKDSSANPHVLHGKDLERELKGEGGAESQATLTLQQDPYSFILWILLILLILFSSFYHFYYQL